MAAEARGLRCIPTLPLVCLPLSWKARRAPRGLARCTLQAVSRKEAEQDELVWLKMVTQQRSLESSGSLAQCES